jgi:hypothetical protein
MERIDIHVRVYVRSVFSLCLRQWPSVLAQHRTYGYQRPNSLPIGPPESQLLFLAFDSHALQIYLFSYSQFAAKFTDILKELSRIYS